MQKNTIVSVILVVLILLGGLAFWAFNRGVLYFNEGSMFPRFSKVAIMHPVPSLDRTPSYSTDFPAEGRILYETKVTKLKETLTKEPANLEAWLDLAIYYRMVGDHEGAIEIWEYLRTMYPQDSISRHNLGEYYFHTVKDYEKAEIYYEESIAVSPGLESNYTDMYEMYKYVYKQDTTAALDILKRGIEKAAGPSAIQFKIMLGREYRDRGDKENAKKYLTEARDAAQEAGNRSLSNDLTREISAL
jgi:tetratricopeptide (TPR) repeat protein